MRSLNEVIVSKEKDFIINGIMKPKRLYCLNALPKIGKSMLALQLSDSVTNNKQFLGMDINPSPVLYISTENDGNQLNERTKLMNITLKDDQFKYIDRYEYNSFNLRDMQKEFKNFAEELNGKLVIIDMLKDIEFDFHYDINNYQDIDKALKELRYLCDKYNFSILYIHHLNKKGNSLGSTALDGSVDGIFTLSKVKDYDNRYTLKITNRDFPSKDISLIKDEKCILSICDDVLEEDIDYNLMLLIKYISNKGNIEFTCSEIVNKANLQLTPKQLGIRLKKWKDILLKEGINISYKKSAKQRLYSAYYEEKTEEDCEFSSV